MTRTAGSPAAAVLRQRKIAFELHEYHHEDRSSDYGDEAVRALSASLGCLPSAIFKTLVWQVDDRPCVAVVPVPDRVSAKLLAAALGGRRAGIADRSLAERISGSVLGAISPLALRRAVPIVIDASATGHDRVFVSAGRRGLEIEIAPDDLAEVTGARIAPLVSGASAG